MTARSTDPVLTVFAWGNTCRGDDAIGPLLAERLRSGDTAGLRVIEDHQLNIEHVTDLCRDVTALFIDASVEIDQGFRLERIGPSRDGNFSTHAISPQALLNVYQTTTGEPAPDAWLLHVAARDFRLGGEPGDVARRAMAEAGRFLHTLLAEDPTDWRACLARHASTGQYRIPESTT